MCLVVQARKLKPGIIEILSHPTTHILVSGQGEILKANQPRVYEHIMEHVIKSLLIWTINEAGKKVYHPFTQLAVVGDTTRGWCLVHRDKNVAVNIITHIRFFQGPSSIENEGATIFYPGGIDNNNGYYVKMKHLRSILANFRQVFHNANDWTNGACD